MKKHALWTCLGALTGLTAGLLLFFVVSRASEGDVATFGSAAAPWIALGMFLAVFQAVRNGKIEKSKE